jgi:hypothetical protein
MFAGRFAFQSPQATGAGNARRTAGASTNASLSWTANDSVTTSTTQAKYGTASERLVNINSHINSANTTIGGMGTTDFTIECYIWLDSLSNHNASSDVYSHDTAFGFGIRLAPSFNGNSGGNITNKMNIFARQQADLDVFTLSANWPTGQWNFVVIQRKSGSFAAWVNGTLCTKSNASSSYNFDTGSATLRVGTADGGSGLGPTSGSDYVYIDEFCISNTYRYNDPTSNILVPTAPFTVDAYTVQLLHMDGSNGGTTFTNATS